MVGGLWGLLEAYWEYVLAFDGQAHYSYPWCTLAYDNGLIGTYGSIPAWITRKLGVQCFLGVQSNTMLSKISLFVRGGRHRTAPLALLLKLPSFIHFYFSEITFTSNVR